MLLGALSIFELLFSEKTHEREVFAFLWSFSGNPCPQFFVEHIVEQGRTP